MAKYRRRLAVYRAGVNNSQLLQTITIRNDNKSLSKNYFWTMSILVVAAVIFYKLF